MKVSILKISRNKEVIKRLEVAELAEMIRHNPDEEKVYKVRLNYQFMQPQRLDDGQIVVDNEQHTVNLPRILFAAECVNFKEKQKGLRYNGLVVIEVNNLKTYEEAVNIRNQAARMDETMMAFLGASGKSVKIVCRGELFQTNELPQEDADIRQFHKNLYDTARRAYQNQFGIDIEYLDPKYECRPRDVLEPGCTPIQGRHRQARPARTRQNIVGKRPTYAWTHHHANISLQLALHSKTSAGRLFQAGRRERRKPTDANADANSKHVA